MKPCAIVSPYHALLILGEINFCFPPVIGSPLCNGINALSLQPTLGTLEYFVQPLASLLKNYKMKVSFLYLISKIILKYILSKNHDNF